MMRRLTLLCLAVLTWAAAATAHEVRPAIGDLTVSGGQVTLQITMNAEPIVAGVNLDGVEDTNDTDNSDAVDALRALPPEEMAAQLAERVPQMSDSIAMTVGGTPVTLTATDITVGPVGNVELPRDTVLTLTGAATGDTLEMSWPAEYGTLILRQQGVEAPYTGYLSGGQSTGPISLGGGDAQTGWDAFLSYIPVGFEHIVPMGLDHILFVLGLFFLSTRLGPLLWQISAFTLAHTVTLALGALGYVSIPASIVEPIIAASIVFVAVENITSRGLSKWRPVVVFVFGLLHGLGFASVLGEFGLPQGQFIPALVGFNVGVEVGQLTVIAAAFMLVWVALRVDTLDMTDRTGEVFYGVLAAAFVVLAFLADSPGFTEAMGVAAPVIFIPLAGLSLLCLLSAVHVDKLDSYRTYVAVPASAAIALVGAWWFVERVFL
ncbi:HupE/UreJ family protein [Thalassococcus sp. BH17M4-6]|uniref:HupE/UreJ family protein n=1 Tax=Thalassococcus sp. BH17M4-6 TaxID=3413148 RepID=UPI003BC46D6F